MTKPPKHNLALAFPLTKTPVIVFAGAFTAWIGTQKSAEVGESSASASPGCPNISIPGAQSKFIMRCTWLASNSEEEI